MGIGTGFLYIGIQRVFGGGERGIASRLVWCVVDYLAGVSVVISHRRGFHKHLQSKGIEGLLTLLRIRADRLTGPPTMLDKIQAYQGQ